MCAAVCVCVCAAIALPRSSASRVLYVHAHLARKTHSRVAHVCISTSMKHNGHTDHRPWAPPPTHNHWTGVKQRCVCPFWKMKTCDVSAQATQVRTHGSARRSAGQPHLGRATRHQRGGCGTHGSTFHSLLSSPAHTAAVPFPCHFAFRLAIFWTISNLAIVEALDKRQGCPSCCSTGPSREVYKR